MSAEGVIMLLQQEHSKCFAAQQFLLLSNWAYLSWSKISDVHILWDLSTTDMTPTYMYFLFLNETRDTEVEK
jgi:hypothetical protein